MLKESQPGILHPAEIKQTSASKVEGPGPSQASSAGLTGTDNHLSRTPGPQGEGSTGHTSHLQEPRTTLVAERPKSRTRKPQELTRVQSGRGNARQCLTALNVPSPFDPALCAFARVENLFENPHTRSQRLYPQVPKPGRGHGVRRRDWVTNRCPSGAGIPFSAETAAVKPQNDKGEPGTHDHTARTPQGTPDPAAPKQPESPISGPHTMTHGPVTSLLISPENPNVLGSISPG